MSSYERDTHFWVAQHEHGTNGSISTRDIPVFAADAGLAFVADASVYRDEVASGRRMPVRREDVPGAESAGVALASDVLSDAEC